MEVYELHLIISTGLQYFTGICYILEHLVIYNNNKTIFIQVSLFSNMDLLLSIKDVNFSI